MLESLIETNRLAWSRVRAFTWKTRGSTIGDKVSIGSGSRVDFPRCVSLAKRVTLENEVWLKLVSDNAKLSVGEFSFIGRGVELDVSERVEIGANVLIAPRVFITDHSHNMQVGIPINQQGCASRPIVIGNDVWIGTGATILPGVTIGDGAVIGAGAVLRQDVPSNEIWAGLPARKIRNR